LGTPRHFSGDKLAAWPLEHGIVHLTHRVDASGKTPHIRAGFYHAYRIVKYLLNGIRHPPKWLCLTVVGVK
jgi:hypothetical protein